MNNLVSRMTRFGGFACQMPLHVHTLATIDYAYGTVQLSYIMLFKYK